MNNIKCVLLVFFFLLCVHNWQNVKQTMSSYFNFTFSLSIVLNLLQFFFLLLLLLILFNFLLKPVIFSVKMIWMFFRIPFIVRILNICMHCEFHFFSVIFFKYLLSANNAEPFWWINKQTRLNKFLVEIYLMCTWQIFCFSFLFFFLIFKKYIYVCTILRQIILLIFLILALAKLRMTTIEKYFNFNLNIELNLFRFGL